MPPSRRAPPSKPNRSADDNVVALSRYRAQLGRGRKLRRADALLSGPEPERAVRALPGDEFYYVVHELGLSDAADILALARPEQIQAALDFGVWERDQLAPERVTEWLEALAEAPPERIAAWVQGLDVELLGEFDDLVGDGLHMPRRCPRGNDHEVGDAALAADIDLGHVARLELFDRLEHRPEQHFGGRRGIRKLGPDDLGLAGQGGSARGIGGNYNGGAGCDRMTAAPYRPCSEM